VDDPESWRWVWLGAAVAGIVGEMLTAGSFFLLPFGIGAGVACVAAFAGAGLGLQWLLFLATSAALTALARPLAKRLNQVPDTSGVGARRWVGQSAVVLADIPAGPDETGLVRVGREEWRAQAADGAGVPAGTRVTVIDMTGTRLVVTPTQGEPA
jgi:membrane protein implicated in regulation of membrane protease activity